MRDGELQRCFNGQVITCRAWREDCDDFSFPLAESRHERGLKNLDSDNDIKDEGCQAYG